MGSGAASGRGSVRAMTAADCIRVCVLPVHWQMVLLAVSVRRYKASIVVGATFANDSAPYWSTADPTVQLRL